MEKIKYRNVVIPLYIIAALFIITYIITLSVNLNAVDAAKAGSIGDTLGGLANPFIGSMGVIVTFLAFWVQFEANESQRKDIRHERFENKFFELLRLHKENVNEININHGTYKGRSAFIKMFQEYKFIYKECETLLKDSPFDSFHSREEMIHCFTFDFFMYGVGPTSDSYFEERYKGVLKSNAQLLIDHFKAIHTQYNTDIGEPKKPPIVIIDTEGELDGFPTPKYPTDLNYRPVDGHLSRLNHYFRHIYQLVKFMGTNTSLGLNWDEKYEYIKVFRAQLSVHEIAILYFNSFWPQARKMWVDDVQGKTYNYLVDFKLLRNLPPFLNNFGIQPKDKLRYEIKKQSQEISVESLNNTIGSYFESYELPK